MSEIDSAPYLQERIVRVLDELQARVEGELTEADWLALSTAIAKAALGGFREGCAHTAVVAQTAGLTIELGGTIADDSQDPDWWLAAGYGNGTDLPGSLS